MSVHQLRFRVGRSTPGPAPNAQAIQPDLDGLADVEEPFEHNELIYVVGVGYFRFDAGGYLAVVGGAREGPGFRVKPASGAGGASDPGVWEYIGDPGHVDATWFDVRSWPIGTSPGALVNEDQGPNASRAIAFAHRLAKANTGLGAELAGGSIVLFPAGLIPGHFINRSDVIVAGRSRNATVFQAIRNEPVFRLETNSWTIRFGLRDLGVRGLYDITQPPPSNQQDPLYLQHGVYWSPPVHPFDTSAWVDTASLERVNIIACGGYGFCVEGLGQTQIEGLAPSGLADRHAQHIHLRDVYAERCLRSGIAFQGICFECSMADIMATHCGSKTHAAVAIRKKTHLEEVNPNALGLPPHGPLRVVGSNVTLNNHLKHGDSPGAATNYGRVGLLVDDARHVSINGYDIEESYPALRVTGPNCYNIGLREGSIGVGNAYSGENDVPQSAVELARVKGFEMKNWHLIGPFVQVVTQLDHDPEHDPNTTLPVHAVRDVDIALPVVFGANFERGVQLDDEVEVVDHMLWAIRKVLSVHTPSSSTVELWRINGSPSHPPMDDPMHPLNLTTVNLSYGQDLILRLANSNDGRLDVKHLAGKLPGHSVGGNIVLKGEQDRVLTGRETLRLVWVDQEELWYET
jgi:hypothetical protein